MRVLLLVTSFIFISCQHRGTRAPASVAEVDSNAIHCYASLDLDNEFKQDPFYRPAIMQKGKYKGECVDNRERRSIFILDHNDKRLGELYGIKPKSNHFYFVNFKHHNKYYLAEFEKGSITQSFLVFEKFLEASSAKYSEKKKLRLFRNIVLSGHAQLRFVLKKGKTLKLYSQIPQKKRIAPLKIKDFAFAMFAVRPKSTSGELYDPLGDGMNNGYVLSQNFMSTYDVALTYKDYVVNDTEVSQFRFEEAKFDGNKAFEALLKFSHDDYIRKKQVFYHTLTNNCITSMFVGIDAGAHSENIISKGIGAVRDIFRPIKASTGGKEWNPAFVLPALYRRGLLKRQGSEIISLNEEVCQILKGEDFQDVKSMCDSL